MSIRTDRPAQRPRIFRTSPTPGVAWYDIDDRVEQLGLDAIEQVVGHIRCHGQPDLAVVGWFVLGGIPRRLVLTAITHERVSDRVRIAEQ